MDACSLCYWNFRLCFAIVIFLPGPLFPFLSFSSSRLHLAMVFLSVSLVFGSSPFYYFYLLLSSSLFSFFAIAFPISLHSSLPLPSLTLCLYPTFALLSLGLFLLLHLLFLIFSPTLLCLFPSPILLCVVFRSLISFNIFSFVILLSISFSSPELFFLTQFSSSTSLSSFHSDPSSPSFLFLPTNVFLFLSSPLSCRNLALQRELGRQHLLKQHITAWVSRIRRAMAHVMVFILVSSSESH